MSVYKLTEVVGTSKEGFAEPTREAVKRASKNVRGTSWFEVSEYRGTIKDGDIDEYQVKVKIGFKLED
ncbi:dodecin flavoprotein [bacterium SCN 62-11]|nr:dodecin domain-containing protein [Candidatus Eremiobacteraeota bacterium]ODT68595.1 MAG: dodecin flavoprotein [bacterium SCN 62-11]